MQEKNSVHALFMHCSRTVHGSYNTIHTFKNYFVTVFSIFNFNKNKFNPNRLIETIEPREKRGKKTKILVSNSGSK